MNRFPVSRKSRFALAYLLFMFLFSLPYLADERFNDLKVTKTYNGFIASASAGLYNIFPGEDVMVSGATISGGGKAVEVKTGCNGLLMTLIYCAGVAAFPAALRWKVIGLGAGLFGIFIFNLLRVNALFLIYRHLPEYFHTAHVTAGQFIGILFSLSLWVVWLNGTERA